MTPFKEDAWDPKVICKWLIQIGLVVSFIYLSYRTYLIYQDPPNDVDQKKSLLRMRRSLYIFQ